MSALTPHVRVCCDDGQDGRNIVLLLKLLDLTDFYVRFHTVNLLKLLLANQPRQLQTTILESGEGVSRLVDLLDDARELIRNGAADAAPRVCAPSVTLTQTPAPPLATCRGAAAVDGADQGQC